MISSLPWTTSTPSTCVLGLCGAPDVAHTAGLTTTAHHREQSYGGVGDIFKLSEQQGKEIVQASRQKGHVNILFKLHLTESKLDKWITVLKDGILYLTIPDHLLPEGSKEAFIALLEYAEEVLHCTNIIMCIKKNREDRALLVRTFMFLGFGMMPPGHPLIPQPEDPNYLYLIYTIE